MMRRDGIMLACGFSRHVRQHVRDGEVLFPLPKSRLCQKALEMVVRDVWQDLQAGWRARGAPQMTDAFFSRLDMEFRRKFAHPDHKAPGPGIKSLAVEPDDIDPSQVNIVALIVDHEMVTELVRYRLQRQRKEAEERRREQRRREARKREAEQIRKQIDDGALELPEPIREHIFRSLQYATQERPGDERFDEMFEHLADDYLDRGDDDDD
ncbi:MAG: hypothetical protein ABEN55_00450 [Bradymonadaceae bacterium]